MSQENVDVAQAAFAAWNAGDMDSLRELYHPDAIVRRVENWPEPGPFVGRDAVMRQWEQLRDTYDADTLEPISDFRPVADHVVVRWVWHGVGQGPDPNLEMTHVYTMRNGKIFELEYFWDHTEALEAVGLSDKDAGRDVPGPQ